MFRAVCLPLTPAAGHPPFIKGQARRRVPVNLRSACAVWCSSRTAPIPRASSAGPPWRVIASVRPQTPGPTPRLAYPTGCPVASTR